MAEISEKEKVESLNQIDDPYPCNAIVDGPLDFGGPLQLCEDPEHDPFSRKCYAHMSGDLYTSGYVNG